MRRPHSSARSPLSSLSSACLYARASAARNGLYHAPPTCRPRTAPVEPSRTFPVPRFWPRANLAATHANIGAAPARSAAAGHRVRQAGCCWKMVVANSFWSASRMSISSESSNLQTGAPRSSGATLACTVRARAKYPTKNSCYFSGYLLCVAQCQSTDRPDRVCRRRNYEGAAR